MEYCRFVRIRELQLSLEKRAGHMDVWWRRGGAFRGVYDAYTQQNLRYSQTAPLSMYEEKNTGCNLPAQIDLFSTDSDAYEFLFIAKGGGSANKSFLFQETKALLNPPSLEKFCIEKMATLGTSACPPYHIAIVIGGTSAETTMKTVKLASARYYDNLPTEGNAHGQAFRDLALEAKLLEYTRKMGYGAQFGGKYFALDIRVIRLPRHGASCPVGIGVSCSADRMRVRALTRMEFGWRSWKKIPDVSFRSLLKNPNRNHR